MMQTWQLQKARNNLSQVVEAAIASGPQLITRRGVEAVILLSYAEYRRLVSAQKKLSVFFQESPLAGVELDRERDRSSIRPEPVL
jgi:prevent-host-death family protein